MTGTAVGQSGTILHTTDGGTTWTGQQSGTTEDLVGVHFFDPQNGWAVGSKNIIIHTTDGGATWAQQETIAAADSLRGIYLTSLRSGLAAGSGGHIWQYGPVE